MLKTTTNIAKDFVIYQHIRAVRIVTYESLKQCKAFQITYKRANIVSKHRRQSSVRLSSLEPLESCVKYA